MSEYKITTDYLYALCNKKRHEIDSIIGGCHNISDYLNGLADAGTVPTENVEPLTERQFAVLSTLEKTKGMIMDLCDSGLVTGMSVDRVKLRIAKEQNLLYFLQDTNRLEMHFISLINVCSRMLDYWCRQKGVNGESGIDFSTLLNEYQDFILSLKEELIPALENDIQQSRRFTDAIPMACVYASPEIMMRESFANDHSQTYPFIHAESFDEENGFDENYMEEIYGSPEMIHEYEEKSEKTKIMKDHFNDSIKYCLYCGENITAQNNFCPSCGMNTQVTIDPDITIQFCENCRKAIPLISVFCPYCGNRTRISSVQNQPGEQGPPMACVYASPDIMAKPKRKEGIISKLFKGKR